MGNGGNSSFPINLNVFLIKFFIASPSCELSFPAFEPSRFCPNMDVQTGMETFRPLSGEFVARREQACRLADGDHAPREPLTNRQANFSVGDFHVPNCCRKSAERFSSSPAHTLGGPVEYGGSNDRPQRT